MRLSRTAIVMLVVVLTAGTVVAHVPSFPGENTSPAQAIEVPDPVKSWSFYDRLDAGQATYYQATLNAGDRLTVGTFTPQSGEFTPSIVVMSPSLPSSGSVPAAVSVPEGMGAVVVAGERPDGPDIEPFTPSAIYPTASFDQRVDADGTSLIAIYEPANRSGPVGVTIGYRESFSATEYLTVPFELIRIHQWEGQPFALAIGPFVLTVLAGAALVSRRWRATWSRKGVRLAASAAGLLVVGWGVNTLVQLGLVLTATGLTPLALVTLLLAVVPILAGGWVLRLALQSDFRLDIRTRLGLAAAGGLALGTWAGFLVGPAILLVVAAVPSRWLPA